MATVNDYATLSADAYRDSGSPPTGWTRLTVNGFPNTSDPDNGFSTAAYGRLNADGTLGEVVVAYRGMNPIEAGDVASVGQLYAGQKPAQYDAAAAFYGAVRDEYGSQAPVSLTGHSLGGALASMVAAANADIGAVATVFNAVPVKNSLDDIGLNPNGSYGNVNNYNAVFDPASNVPLTDQIGTISTVLVSSFPLIPDWFEPLFASLNPALIFYFKIDQHRIDNLVSANFIFSQLFVPRRDPLTLDLDGDGLETVGIAPVSPILFDHDGDGVKTATGWIASDDGLLVFDRDGNGTIDSGRELFGDATLIPDGQGGERNAADGFEALSAQDTNADGVVDSNDANFADLRIWQDLNQDGLSTANELFTLTQKTIASISVTKTEHSQLLPNGNVIADLGTYTKIDGTVGGLGTTAQLGDVDLNENTFISAFTTPVPLTPEAQALPHMHSSGQVRALQEAASLSPVLATALTVYAQAGTRADQLALLDNLVKAWSDTSLMPTTATGAYTGHPLTLSLEGVAQGSPQYHAWLEKLTILEHFNGRTFRVVPTGTAPVTVAFFGGTLSLLDQSYAALKSSIYDGLLLQTRLKPYLDAIALATDANGNIILDFTGTTDTFNARHTQAPGEAVRDLLDLQRLVGTDLTGTGWDGYGQLRGWLAEVTTTTDPTLQPALIAALADFGYLGLRTQGDGTSANEAVIGADSGAVLNGAGGNDLVLGGDGNDILNGGSGSDTLYGGAGNDTYIVNLGDGADTIIETHGNTGTDTLVFGSGILTGDITITQDGDTLVFAHSNGRDTVSFANWFDSLADVHRLDSVRFADGSSFDLNAVQLGTANADSLTGTVSNDILIGAAGDDVLTGAVGHDWLDGGSGADQMVGGDDNDLYVVDHSGDIVTEAADGGFDTVDTKVSTTLAANVEHLRLVGTAGINGTGNELNNIVTGNEGSNALYGMAGDDTLTGNGGTDLLDGGSGADVMTGGAGDDSYVVDTLSDAVIELANQGTDTIQTALSYTLDANVEHLTLTGTDAVDGTGNELSNVLTGNSADNILTGLAGNDTLNGGSGVDTMLGGTDHDTYVVEHVGDLVIENVNEGTDLVQSSMTYTLTDNVENLTLMGAAVIDGTGNVLDNSIVGNSGNNTLTGLEGNDFLNGGAGGDTLIGGTGNDTYSVDNAGDVVTEHAGEGTDTVQSEISYALVDNVENLTLIGGNAIHGSGNALDNVLTGNGAANTLDGGLGADVMAGGFGNDTYILDNTGDNVTEFSGQGVDTVVSPFDYTLGVNVDNLTLTGVALNGTGNTLDNVIAGTANDNILTGLAGNDTLDGGAGIDTMLGGTGNDTYVVDNLLDTTTEQTGEGVDTVQSNLTWTLASNLDSLTLTGTAAIDGTGNELDNAITGNGAANTLTGLAGHDTLDGGAGADTMLGGAGHDTYVVDNVGDAVIESAGEGTDAVQSSITYTLTDSVENLTLTGTVSITGTGNALDNVIIGNTGTNILTGLEGQDILNGGVGADTLLGGMGHDIYVVDNTADVVIENLDEGTDLVQSSVTYTLSANVENLTLTGSGTINGIGNTQDNTLTGNSSHNVLDGGAGADAMVGGAGNDTYVVDNAADTVTEQAGAGTDGVQAALSYTLTDNVENLTLTGSGNINGTGNALANTITGNAGDNVLSGLTGDDTLIGNAGSDLLNGGAGADTLAGGIGDDAYIVDNVGDIVTENLDEGADTVQSSISYLLTDHVENLALTGAATIDGTGNELHNAITGNSGANIIDGGAGADTLAGSGGDDIYIVDDMGDMVTEHLDEGADTVQSSISYTLTANVENLVLTGTADLNGTGNTLANTITGNSGNNTLDGGASVDMMAGDSGNDAYVVENTADVVVEGLNAGMDTVLASATYTLSDNVENLILTGTDNMNGTGNSLANTITANSGVNILAGLAGDDTYIVGDASDVVMENLNEGADTVQSSASYTLSDNVEILILTGGADLDGTGNALNNTITGNSGANILDGGAGADQMAGEAGHDSFIVDHVDDVTIEAAGAGTDSVYASVSYTLAANVENLTLTSAGDLDATGNELNNVLIGNSGHNRLFGLDGNDSLTGNQGHDTLDGGIGADTLVGNAGQDTYVVDNVGDLVIENLDEGTDLVQSSITYTLTDYVENLTLTGSGTINGTGNLLNNAITGNGGNNVLDGGAGVDTLMGGSGHDTYLVENTADVVVEGLNAGTDLVQASAIYTLSANIENLTLTGTADLNGTGNALANVITANSGVNTLAGLGGNDTYFVDQTADAVIENANDGTDLVQSSATYQLLANVENLTLTGTASIDGTGNTLNNAITGNSGHNVLDGGAGVDTLTGGTGNDTYLVDNTADVVVEGLNAGTDLVLASATYTLSANVENLTLTDIGNINGTGNTLNNIMLGNIGNNRLDGSTGADSMAGSAGNDTYVVDNAGDMVTENLDESIDTVESSVSYTLTANTENLTLTGAGLINGTGNALNNILIGNINNNVLTGLTGNDTLTGNAGSDTLDGGLDADTMAGDAGNDTYVVDHMGDLVTEVLNEGTDLVNSNITYTLTANVENLTLTGVVDINGTGNTLNNTIIGNSGANVIDGATGDDTVNAGAGTDILTGGDGTDVLLGEAGSDTISGNAGNDTLNGGLDADTMAGGTGNDTYVVDHVGDLVTENLNEGTDLVQSSITYSLTDHTENLTLTGTVNINGTGNVLNNIILGNSGVNTLTGLEGDDMLDGGVGIDTMLGGMGHDIYVVDNTADVVIENLGEGTDLVQASASYALSANVENLTLTGAGLINGTGNALQNILIGNINNNVLAGLAGNDTLTGNAGSDTLDGGLDADTMAGNAGNDTYVVDHTGDLVTEALNEGTDTVQSSLTYTLTANVENLTLTGIDTLNGTGNLLANVITGNTAANILDGAAGADTINAGAGDDTLIGGADNDVLFGEAGSDIVSGEAGNDILNGGLDADTMAGGLNDDTYVVDHVGDLVTENLVEGIDLVQSSITYTLTDHIENLTLTGTANINGTGNVLNNIVIGNTGANTLSGLEGHDTLNGNVGNDNLIGGDGNDALNGEAGVDVLHGDAGHDNLNGGLDADIMLGGSGDDTYTVDHLGDVVTENPDEGTDTIQAGISVTLTDHVENLTLTGTANINGTGNALNNILIGNTSNNVLAGLAGTDTLTGNAGSDTLDGGLDADTMAGNVGNDTYVVDHVGDLVTEALNEGIDLVQSSISYTLTANVENLTLTGIDTLNGTGNVLANVITGNSSANVLDGGAGLDTMSGGAGDDTYIVESTGDVINEGLGGGIDIALASANYALAANVEHLTLTGVASINGTGNTLANIIIGNSGANTLTGDAGDDLLNGGLGADTMAGGAGNDTTIVESSGDVVTEALNSGTDTVQSSISYALTANVENLVLTGTAALNGTGNSLNNTIIGNSGVNVIDGGTGADTMTGGVGDDTYVVDQTADVVIESTGEGADSVLASATFTLSADVESLTLTGTATIDGIGNALANVLIGNSGDNVLAGMAGDDILSGEAGHDTYLFNLGDGVDTLNDIATGTASNLIVFGAGIAQSDLSVSQQDGVLTIQVGTGGDAIRLPNFNFSNVEGSVVVGTLQFADGSTASLAALANRTPVVASLLADQSATEDAPFFLAIPAGTFADPDAGDPLLYSATLSDGSALPGWLVFDAIAMTLSGTPANDNVSSLSIRVSATDSHGIRASDDFLLTVANVNDAPTLVVPIADQVTNEDAPFSFQVPATTFADVDAGDSLRYESSLADGFALPAWLTFDPVTRTASGTPVNGDVGLLNVAVRAIDQSGVVASDSFFLTVANVNDAPVVANALVDQSVIRDTPFTYQVPLDAFMDDDAIHGDSLVYSTTRADGSALPAWLSFDAATRLFSGTPGIRDVGGMDVMVTATDTTGTHAADVFSLTVFPGVIYGTDLDDLLSGSASDDEIFGLAGNDVLNGLGGHDRLDGGTGTDTMQGGVGNDTYVVDVAGDLVIELANEGMDTVQTSLLAYTLGDHVENLTLTGTGPSIGVGNASTNVLIGNSGVNLLDGKGGADTMTGGAGDDLYIVDHMNDAVVEQVGEGTLDTVSSSVAYTLSANVENLVLTGGVAINGTGNNLDNILTGNSAANVLTGQTGHDTYIVGTGDTVVEAPNEGTDTVVSGNTHSLAANVEHLTLIGFSAINGAGNALDNVLNGLTNLAGNVLTGEAGNDIYVIGAGDTVVEATNNGTDSVQSSITYTLGANVENLTLIGSTAINGTGNGLNNVLAGNSAANILAGGAGNDTYLVSIGDSVSEANNGGIDTVQSDITWTLASNVENLTVIGTANINGTGNSLNNSLTGNSGANVLDGGIGNDTMSGGAGNDTYVVNATGDTVVELTSEGIDLVQSAVTYTLAAHVEHVTLTGTSAINGTGNALDNTLTGNNAANVLTGGAGHDTLNGGLGNDTMVGGVGDDTLVVNATGDIVTELLNEGTDTVRSSIAYALGAHVENLTLTGTIAINGTGNSVNNVLTGNSAANTLTGAVGNDTLAGGQGNDVLNGGTGHDLYLVNRGDGQETIQDADATVGNVDRLLYGATIDPLDLVLSRQVNNLRIALHGGTEQVTIQNWYTSPTTNQVETIQAGNGQTLLNTQVDQLIQAMAGFTQQTGLTWDQAIDQRPQEVQAVLAASWQ